MSVLFDQEKMWIRGTHAFRKIRTNPVEIWKVFIIVLGQGLTLKAQADTVGIMSVETLEEQLEKTAEGTR